MADKQISQMIRATESHEDDLLLLTQPDGTSDTGYISRAGSVATVADEMLNGIQYATELQTPTKTVLGAINDAYNHGGGGGSSIDDDHVSKNTTYSSSKIESDLGTVNNALNDTNKSLDALWKINKGQTYDIVQQTESGMNNPPSGAKYESLISIDGKSEQFTTNGKNLFDISDFGNHYETSGTSIVGRYPVYVGSGKTVTLSTNYQLKGEYTSVFLLTNVYDSATSVVGAYDGHPRTIVANSDYVYVGLYFNATAGHQTTYQQLIEQGVKIQLEIGSTPTDYEPYTGGIPSPNPEYPQEIKSVEQINISVDGVVKTITPPFPLNKIGDVADVCDIDNGEWVKRITTVNMSKSDYSNFGKDSNSVYARYKNTISSLSLLNTVTVKSNKLVGVDYNNRHTIKSESRIYPSYDANQLWFGIDPNANINSLSELADYIGDMKVIYISSTTESEPISESDLVYFKSLQTLPSENVITITDQDGNDISYLMEYIIKLSEVN